MLLLLLASISAFGATTTTVVDIPTRGVTQRILYVRPDNPVANLVVLSGGDGVLGIQADGTMTTFVAACGPVVRNRRAGELGRESARESGLCRLCPACPADRHLAGGSPGP